MKRIIRSGLIIATVLLIGTAWAGVTTNYDRHANFSKYKTYSWGRVETANSLWDQRAKNAIDSQLAAKGWSQVPSGGDVTVNAVGTLVVEISDSTSNNVVWSSISDDTDKSLEELDKDVKKMFKHFPRTAGHFGAGF